MSRTDTAVRVISASPDRVFAALTASDALAVWLPPGYRPTDDRPVRALRCASRRVLPTEQAFGPSPVLQAGPVPGNHPPDQLPLRCAELDEPVGVADLAGVLEPGHLPHPVGLHARWVADGQLGSRVVHDLRRDIGRIGQERAEEQQRRELNAAGPRPSRPPIASTGEPWTRGVDVPPQTGSLADLLRRWGPPAQDEVHRRAGGLTGRSTGQTPTPLDTLHAADPGAIDPGAAVQPSLIGAGRKVRRGFLPGR